MINGYFHVSITNIIHCNHRQTSKGLYSKSERFFIEKHVATSQEIESFNAEILSRTSSRVGRRIRELGCASEVIQDSEEGRRVALMRECENSETPQRQNDTYLR
jgi:hypothetical protein